MKPGDEILIRAKLINVRESDNEVTVGFDSTTTAVVPLGAVSGPANVSLEAVSKLVAKWREIERELALPVEGIPEHIRLREAGRVGSLLDELAAALAAEGPRQRVLDAIIKGNVETLLAMQAGSSNSTTM